MTERSREVAWAMFRENVVFILGVVLVFASIFWAISTMAVRSNREACQAYSEMTLRDTNFIKTGFMAWECFVRIDEHWVLRSEVHTISEQP